MSRFLEFWGWPERMRLRISNFSIRLRMLRKNRYFRRVERSRSEEWQGFDNRGHGYHIPPGRSHSVECPDESKPIGDIEKRAADVTVAASTSPAPTDPAERKLTVWELRFWIRKEWFWYYIVLSLAIVFIVMIAVYRDQIVHALTPATQWLHDLKCGWLVPIAVLFILSFPPLFGHEIVAMLCGLVWGLWIGFGIVAAGTFVGEIGNFYAFKYACRARGRRYERTKVNYGCFAKIVRDGGFKMALIARISAIPSHFTTAVFSTCGMGIIVYSVAAILSLPKQLTTVYIGVIIGQGQGDAKAHGIDAAVVTPGVLITIAALWYIYREMNKVKPQILSEIQRDQEAKSTAQIILAEREGISNL
ncbi:hypothetical protein C8J56DRAFT_958471 [Mycena floridula]|nr:hypothetical protein C8J56DRAFT_958471 [Mycena floridula]